MPLEEELSLIDPRTLTRYLQGELSLAIQAEILCVSNRLAVCNCNTCKYGVYTKSLVLDNMDTNVILLQEIVKTIQVNIAPMPSQLDQVVQTQNAATRDLSTDVRCLCTFNFNFSKYCHLSFIRSEANKESMVKRVLRASVKFLMLRPESETTY